MGFARALYRGRCDTDIPGNMGKLMRSVVVRKLREGLPPGEEGAPQEKVAPEINVCCHGQDAGAEVRCPPLQRPVLRLHCLACCFQGAELACGAHPGGAGPCRQDRDGITA